jgi:hypothetical protein
MAEPHNWAAFDLMAQRGGFAGSSESLSGPGSSLDATKVLRPRLADILYRLGVKSLVDAPCGDMNWMRHLNYSFEKFIGIDVSPFLISKLRAEKFPPEYHFQVGNIATDILPAADAIFCRDCLVHLPFEIILGIPDLWRAAGFRFMMATTFVKKTQNEDCKVGNWRPLNMEIAPFNWLDPIAVISEDYQDPTYGDKAIGVWAL